MVDKHLERDRSHAFMCDMLGATHCYWTILGPAQSDVEYLSCYQLPDGRLVIVEDYSKGGFDTFTQAQATDLDGLKAEMIAANATTDMLAALKAALPHVSDEIEQRKTSGHAEHWADLEAVEKQMIDAIAKAEGREVSS